MAVRATVSNLRNGIEEIYHDLMAGQDNGEVSNAAVLARIRRDKAGEIAELDTQLVDIALVKLLNEISRRKGKRGDDAAMPDLFGDYRGIPKSVSLARGRKNSTAYLTLSQALSWVQARTEKQEDDRHAAFRRMIDDCTPYQQSPDDTLAVMMERKLAAERLTLI